MGPPGFTCHLPDYYVGVGSFGTVGLLYHSIDSTPAASLLLLLRLHLIIYRSSVMMIISSNSLIMIDDRSNWALAITNWSPG